VKAEHGVCLVLLQFRFLVERFVRRVLGRNLKERFFGDFLDKENF
jgi:hypothetical protein